MVIGKLMSGVLVEIVKVQNEVQFSSDTGWILICSDFGQVSRKRKQYKWIPAIGAQFMWVREYIG